MNRVFVTGDCHGDIQRLVYFVRRMELGAGDAIIVLGDLGIAWRKDKKDLECNIKHWEEDTNGVLLYFVDGNHENFDILQNLPKVAGTGQISEHIYHLLRGETYYIAGKKILTVGGADSIDRGRRTPGLNWWEQETITENDIAAAAGHYDYVFTHCCPLSVFKDNQVYLATLGGVDQSKVDHRSEIMLDKLKSQITFDNWWFGHYHLDMAFDDKFRCVLNDFIELQ